MHNAMMFSREAEGTIAVKTTFVFTMATLVSSTNSTWPISQA